MSTRSEFRDNLQSLINSHSQENNSNTPDFILAEYLTDCLDAFDKATNRRHEWFGHPEPFTVNVNVESPIEENIDGRN